MKSHVDTALRTLLDALSFGGAAQVQRTELPDSVEWHRMGRARSSRDGAAGAGQASPPPAVPAPAQAAAASQQPPTGAGAPAALGPQQLAAVQHVVQQSSDEAPAQPALEVQGLGALHVPQPAAQGVDWPALSMALETDPADLRRELQFVESNARQNGPAQQAGQPEEAAAVADGTAAQGAQAQAGPASGQTEEGEDGRMEVVD